MPRRILIHPGFHKTGTSSIQQFLWVNRAALSPYVGVLQMRHLKPSVKISLNFSRKQNPLLLADLVTTFDEAIEEFGPRPDTDDDRDIIVSCEAFSGHCPGWPHVPNYETAPFLASVIAGYFAERFDGAEIMLVYSTREAEPWLWSAWRHHLAGQRLEDDFETWAPKFRPAADHMRAVAAIAASVAPVQVFTLPLEEARAHPKGPGGALIELINIPAEVRQSLTPILLSNEGPPDDITAELLRMNRSDLDDTTLAQRKKALLDEANVGGWTNAHKQAQSAGG